MVAEGEGGHRDGRALLLSLSPCRQLRLLGEEYPPDGRLVRARLVLLDCMPEVRSWTMNPGPTLVLTAFYRRSQLLRLHELMPELVVVVVEGVAFDCTQRAELRRVRGFCPCGMLGQIWPHARGSGQRR
jgi:hypothetical protein